MSYVYEKTDMAAIQADIAKREKQGSSDSYKVPEKGDFVFLCPRAHGQPLPYKEVLIHYNVDPNDKVFCLKNFGQACPICDANRDLYNMKSNPQAQVLSKDIYAKKSYYYNVIPSVGVDGVPPNCIINYKGAPDQGPAVKLWLMGVKLHGLISNFFAVNGDIFDPNAGNVLQLLKMNQSSDPKFAQTFANPIPHKARLNDQLMQLLNNMHNLGAQIKQEDPQRLKALIDAKMSLFRLGAISVPANMPMPQQQMQGYYQQPQQQAPQYPQQQAPMQQPMPQQAPMPQNGGYVPTQSTGYPVNNMPQYPTAMQAPVQQQAPMQMPPVAPTIGASPAVPTQQAPQQQQPQQQAPVPQMPTLSTPISTQGTNVFDQFLKGQQK